METVVAIYMTTMTHAAGVSKRIAIRTQDPRLISMGRDYLAHRLERVQCIDKREYVYFRAIRIDCKGTTNLMLETQCLPVDNNQSCSVGGMMTLAKQALMTKRDQYKVCRVGSSIAALLTINKFIAGVITPLINRLSLALFAVVLHENNSRS